MYYFISSEDNTQLVLFKIKIQLILWEQTKRVAGYQEYDDEEEEEAILSITKRGGYGSKTKVPLSFVIVMNKSKIIILINGSAPTNARKEEK